MIIRPRCLARRPIPGSAPAFPLRQPTADAQALTNKIVVSVTPKVLNVRSDGCHRSATTRAGERSIVASLVDDYSGLSTPTATPAQEQGTGGGWDCTIRSATSRRRRYIGSRPSGITRTPPRTAMKLQSPGHRGTICT